MVQLLEQSTPTILWDMNGVLIDDEPLHEKCFSEILKDYCGIELSHEDYVNHFYGKTDLLGMEDFFKTVEPDINPTTLTLLCGEKNRNYVDYRNTGLAVAANAKELLEDLSSKGYKQALVTCDQRQDVDVILERFLPNVFQSVVSAQDVKNSKPFADPYLKAASQVGIPIEKCIVIEDSLSGVISAQKAGASVIGVSEIMSTKHARELEVVGAKRVVTDLSLFSDDYFSFFVEDQLRDSPI